MRAAVATAAGAPLALTGREVPEPGPGEVLVRITTCGVCSRSRPRTASCPR